MVANWKMYKTVAESLAFGRELSRRLEGRDNAPHLQQVICPTLPALYPLKQRLMGTAVSLGAQTLDLGREGANTGAVSSYLIRDAGADYVILGHSERRQLFGEDDALVAEKVKSALLSHLKPIICVGESHQERQDSETDAVIQRQVSAVVKGTEDDDVSLVFAYEPLWAIGTGVVPDPNEANRVAQVIVDTVRAIRPNFVSSMRILYGGSVNRGNIRDFAAQPLIDGALVGGASLDVEHWLDLNRLWGAVHS